MRPNLPKLSILLLVMAVLLPAAAEAVIVREVRVARHDSFARCVIELDRHTTFRYRNASLAEQTVSIELSGVTSGPTGTRQLGEVPAVSSSRVDFQSSRKLFYVHLQTSGGVRIEKQQLDNPARLVFDLYPEEDGWVSVSPAPSAEPSTMPVSTSAVPAPSADKGTRKRTIVIDAGHGGRHRGGIGSVRGKRVYEAEVTLPVALLVEEHLRGDPMFEPRLTRRSDVYIGLRERTRLAEQFDGDLFLSIHYNAVPASAPKTKARGLEFFTWSPRNGDSVADRYLVALENEEGEESALSGTSRDAREVLSQLMVDTLEEQALESKVFAKSLENAFLRDRYFRDHYRGIKSGRFKVLENYNMPSVLIEIAFISHPDEARKAVDSAFQRRVAKHIYDGIVEYYETVDPQFRAARARALASSK